MLSPGRVSALLARGIACLSALALLSLSSPAWAEPPPLLANGQNCVFERYISVAASGFDAALAEEVRKDLAAELAPRGFGVCASHAAQGELVADVVLVQREPALVAIEVDDYTTGKRIARDVRLARIPAGGVALAIAIATDELLRASWAELILLRRAPTPPAAELVSPPAPPSEPEAQQSAPWRKRREKLPAALALSFDYAHTASHWNGLGFDVRLLLRPFRYGFFELGAAARGRCR